MPVVLVADESPPPNAELRSALVAFLEEGCAVLDDLLQSYRGCVGAVAAFESKVAAAFPPYAAQSDLLPRQKYSSQKTLRIPSGDKPFTEENSAGTAGGEDNDNRTDTTHPPTADISVGKSSASSWLPQGVRSDASATAAPADPLKTDPSLNVGGNMRPIRPTFKRALSSDQYNASCEQSQNSFSGSAGTIFARLARALHLSLDQCCDALAQVCHPLSLHLNELLQQRANWQQLHLSAVERRRSLDDKVRQARVEAERALDEFFGGDQSISRGWETRIAAESLEMAGMAAGDYTSPSTDGMVTEAAWVNCDIGVTAFDSTCEELRQVTVDELRVVGDDLSVLFRESLGINKLVYERGMRLVEALANTCDYVACECQAIADGADRWCRHHHHSDGGAIGATDEPVRQHSLEGSIDCSNPSEAREKETARLELTRSIQRQHGRRMKRAEDLLASLGHIADDFNDVVEFSNQQLSQSMLYLGPKLGPGKGTQEPEDRFCEEKMFLSSSELHLSQPLGVGQLASAFRVDVLERGLTDVRTALFALTAAAETLEECVVLARNQIKIALDASADAATKATEDYQRAVDRRQSEAHSLLHTLQGSSSADKTLAPLMRQIAVSTGDQEIRLAFKLRAVETQLASAAGRQVDTVNVCVHSTFDKLAKLFSQVKRRLDCRAAQFSAARDHSRELTLFLLENAAASSKSRIGGRRTDCKTRTTLPSDIHIQIVLDENIDNEVDRGNEVNKLRASDCSNDESSKRDGLKVDSSSSDSVICVRLIAPAAASSMRQLKYAAAWKSSLCVPKFKCPAIATDGTSGVAVGDTVVVTYPRGILWKGWIGIGKPEWAEELIEFDPKTVLGAPEDCLWTSEERLPLDSGQLEALFDSTSVFRRRLYAALPATLQAASAQIPARVRIRPKKQSNAAGLQSPDILLTPGSAAAPALQITNVPPELMKTMTAWSPAAAGLANALSKEQFTDSCRSLPMLANGAESAERGTCFEDDEDELEASRRSGAFSSVALQSGLRFPSDKLAQAATELAQRFPETAGGELEPVVGLFSCALGRKILLHGKLYVTPRLMAFWSVFNDSTVFGTEATSQVIRWEDVATIKKKNVALFIPNSIEFTTVNGDSFFFASFIARDKTFRFLHDIWQRAKSSTSNAGGREDDQSEGDNFVPRDSGGARHYRRAASSENISAAVGDGVSILAVSDPVPWPVSAGDDGPLKHVWPAAVITLPLAKVFNDLFGTNAFECNMLKGIGCEIISHAEWNPPIPKTDIAKLRAPAARHLTFWRPNPRTALSAFIRLPPRAMVEERSVVYRLAASADSGACVIVESETQATNMPFGDYFLVRFRYKLSSHPTPSCCQIDCEAATIWRRSTFLKSRIETEVLASTERAVTTFVQDLRKFYAPASPLGPSAGRPEGPPLGGGGVPSSPPPRVHVLSAAAFAESGPKQVRMRFPSLLSQELLPRLLLTWQTAALVWLCILLLRLAAITSQLASVVSLLANA